MQRWRRILLWSGGVIAALAVLAAAGLWLALRSGAVHNALLRTARARAAAAVGVPVTLGDLRLRLHGLSLALEVDNVVVPGAAPFAAPPLLQLPRARIGIAITSLVPFRWRLRSVELDRPVVHLVFAPGGGNNLPRPRAPAGPGADVFQLAVRRLVVIGGEVVVNARAVPVSADLRQLNAEAAATPGARGYRGRIGFAAGSLRVGRLPPLTHRLAAAFRATPAGASFSGVRWSTPGAVLSGAATVRGYAHPRVDARYRLQLETGALRARLRLPALPLGAVTVVGQARYSAAAGLALEGAFSSPRLLPAQRGMAAPFTRVAGRYAFARGTLTLSDLRAELLGGALRASLTDRGLLTPAASARLTASLRGVRLEDAAALGNARPTLRRLGLEGRLDAQVAAAWRGAFRALALSADASLTAALRRPNAPPLPLGGALRARLAGGVVEVASAELHTPSSSVRVSGTIDWRARPPRPGAHSVLRVTAGSRDLGEVEALARALAPALGARPLPALGLSGAGRFTGIVAGALAAPRVTGRLRLAPVAVAGSRWRSLALALSADATRLELRDVEAAAAGGGTVSARLSLGLRGFALPPSSPVRAEVEVRGLPLAALGAPLGRALPVTGLLRAQATVSGPLAQPQVRGTASLAAAGLRLGGVTQPFAAAAVSFQGTPAALRAQLRLLLPAGAVTASGEFAPPTGAYQLALDAPHLAPARLAWLAAHHLAVAGEVALSASGRGTLAAPAGRLLLTSARLTAAGQSVTALRLEAALAPGRVSAQLAATALATPLRAQAEVALTPGLPATLHLDAPAVPLAPALAAFAPALAGRLQGRTALAADLRGPLRDPAAWQGTVAVPALDLRYPPSLRLAAAAPLRLTLAQGVLTLPSAVFTGTDTRLTVAARVPLRGGGMQVNVGGQAGLRLAQLFVPGAAFGGQASLHLALTGPLAHPVFGGAIDLAGASVSSPSFPLALTNGRGRLRLSAQRLDVASFTADAGGGVVTVTGGMALRPALRFDFGVAARNLGVRYPDTLREQVSADLTLTGTPRAAALGGRAQVTRVSVLPGFDFTRFVSRLAAAAPVVAAPGSFLQALALNVAVTTPNRIAIATPDFSLDANATINLRGVAAEPILLGRMDLDRGDLIFNGQRYQLSGGTLDFANPARTEPVVNVSATATIRQYNLYLNFQGPASNLRTTYTSNPPLPPADIIHLLAFGSTAEASAANPLPGNLGAENLIASAVSAQITGRVQKLVGISQLSIDPVLRGANQNAGARITVQQRVTGNLFVTFSTDTTGTTRNVVEIQYSFTPRVSLSAVRDQNGGFGVSARFKKVW